MTTQSQFFDSKTMIETQDDNDNLITLAFKMKDDEVIYEYINEEI